MVAGLAFMAPAQLWAVPTALLPLGGYRLARRAASRLATRREESLISLAKVMGRVHPTTVEHLFRVGDGVAAVAIRLGLPNREANRLRIAAILHDVGKVAVDRSVLDKPGSLNEAEMDLVRQHPVHGFHILSSCPLLRRVALEVRHHHERIDGYGYPDGLAGDKIPLGSRIIGVVDAFDAMTGGDPPEPRPYRRPMTKTDALAELERCAGTQFDANVVEAFKAYQRGVDANIWA